MPSRKSRTQHAAYRAYQAASRAANAEKIRAYQKNDREGARAR